jgi:hypothetical protein
MFYYGDPGAHEAQYPALDSRIKTQSRTDEVGRRSTSKCLWAHPRSAVCYATTLFLLTLHTRIG